jgi:hypothetical protein
MRMAVESACAFAGSSAETDESPRKKGDRASASASLWERRDRYRLSLPRSALNVKSGSNELYRTGTCPRSSKHSDLDQMTSGTKTCPAPQLIVEDICCVRLSFLSG